MRQISGGTRTELRAATKRPVLFIEAEFRTAWVRLWTGSGKSTWKGQEWSGPPGAKSGAGLSLEGFRESGAVEAGGLKFVLSNVDTSLLGYCMDELSITKACKVWLGFVNEAGALADDPICEFKGRMDASNLVEDPASGAGRITVTVENEMRRLQIPVLRLLTDADQQIDFPGDTGLKNMSKAENFKGMWGQRQISGSGVSSHGGGTTGGVPKWKEDSE